MLVVLSVSVFFCFPFRKGANNCYKPSHKQQTALKKCIFQNPDISKISDNNFRKHLREQNHRKLTLRLALHGELIDQSSAVTN